MFACLSPRNASDLVVVFERRSHSKHAITNGEEGARRCPDLMWMDDFRKDKSQGMMVRIQANIVLSLVNMNMSTAYSHRAWLDGPRISGLHPDSRSSVVHRSNYKEAAYEHA